MQRLAVLSERFKALSAQSVASEHSQSAAQCKEWTRILGEYVATLKIDGAVAVQNAHDVKLAVLAMQRRSAVT